ncbi:uncharacterized protein LOC128675377 isoform X2 [Plodia interpunctella]|uniref:uncharacterized protein LOC128675377 isoform X2 n=1 Tax=Plodia interpunctella TaxID=58824 RepID=UPI002368A752|nr:uncharacterized protein LOC128675377 isoform X2 [Plodia interpunctella]
MNKFKLSRRGRKLQSSDDQRILVALPKEVPERTWAEILQKEENDLFIYELREDIIEAAMNICYDKYMEQQTAVFTVHCAATAWLKLINWEFYRHDPGEEPSSYPPCFIPRRVESWIPDDLPEPSPKDSWCKQDLPVVEETTDEVLQQTTSSDSLELVKVEPIPSEYWFPGKVNVPEEMKWRRDKPASVSEIISSSVSISTDEMMGAESEVLQRVTDYSSEELSPTDSQFSALKTTTPVEASLRGAGDSVVDKLRPKRRTDKSRMFSKSNMSGRSKNFLAPIELGDSRSRISVISDCRLRNLRLDTQYEIASEKIDSPPGEVVKRK